MARKKPNQKVQAWIDARGCHRLSDAQVQMARELGMKPRKLNNRGQEPWKMALGAYIESLYSKRFGKERPDLVLSIEEKVKRDEAKRARTKARKEARRLGRKEGQDSP